MASSFSLVLYYRHGCHLCEDFELALGEFLIDLENDEGLTIDVVIRDVDSQPAWRTQFNEAVPILFYHLLGQAENLSGERPVDRPVDSATEALVEDWQQEICRYYFEPPSLHKAINAHS